LDDGAVFEDDLGLWCDVTEVEVCGDVLDEGLLLGGVFFLFGEVGAGDLESVEEESSAFGVECFEGDALEDLTDGDLDGGAVLGRGEVELGVGVGAGALVERLGAAESAGGVVVVAELLLAQGWAAAAVSLGEDVSALVAWFGHVGPLPGFGAKSSKDVT